MKRLLTGVLTAALLLTGCAAAAGAEIPEDRDVCAVASDDSGGACVHTLAQPVYPEFPAYPEEPADGNWTKFERQYAAYWKAVNELRQDGLPEEDAAVLERFAEKSLVPVFSGQEGENEIYSPLSLWSALAMLAQCTDGDSRAQVLDALGADDMEELRERVSRIWTSLYTDSGFDSLLLANSIWLNDSLTGAYVRETLNALAEDYYAGAYEAPMGTAAADQAVSDWIREQTNGLLGGNGPVVKTLDETVAMLVSSLYYRAGWEAEFLPGQTKPGRFTNASGKETEVDFLHREVRDSFLRREGWQAAALPTRLGEMVFILPDEGVSPESLLEGEGLLSGLDFAGEDALQGHVQWSVPKFDVEAELDLMDALEDLGVKDISDFSALTSMPASLTRAKQLARVQVDEEGVEAAAVTVLAADGGLGVVEPDPACCVMDLNRPFLFVIRMSGVPLFVGVVNRVS